MKFIFRNDYESDSLVIYENSEGAPRGVKFKKLLVGIFLGCILWGMLTEIHPYKLLLLELVLLTPVVCALFRDSYIRNR